MVDYQCVKKNTIRIHEIVSPLYLLVIIDKCRMCIDVPTMTNIFIVMQSEGPIRACNFAYLYILPTLSRVDGVRYLCFL